MKAILTCIAEHHALSQEQAEEAMHLLLRGEASPEQTAALLMGLRARGETIDELVGFTRVMRQYAVSVNLDDPHAIDIVGTGGDRSGTFNISTAAAFVSAGAGATVAKHGNRSVSSKCGSADVLTALGVKTELGKEGVEFCLQEAGMAFIFAPYFHPALKHVMPIRRALGTRSFFNILGPLCNPAGVQRQLTGAFSNEVAQMMAQILARLGSVHAVTVHAEDGLDEISLSAPTALFEHRTASPTLLQSTISPEQHGMGRFPLEALLGGDAVENAAHLRAILDGAPGPHRDVVVLNAAYALYTSDRFSDLDACFAAARESIDSGAARGKLEQLIEASNRAPALA